MKKKFLQNFMFSKRFMLFPTFKKKFGVKQNWGEGVKKIRGGGGVLEFFLEE